MSKRNMNAIKLLSAVACALLLGAPGMAGAAVYKCKGKDGRTIYQGAPCGKEQEGYELDAKDQFGRGESSSADQLWINQNQPMFRTECPRMNHMALQAVGSQLNGDTVAEICRCAARRYFSGSVMPVAKLRALDDQGDAVALSQVSGQAVDECRKQIVKDRP